jgi:hypothetical protein
VVIGGDYGRACRHSHDIVTKKHPYGSRWVMRGGVIFGNGERATDMQTSKSSNNGC